MLKVISVKYDIDHSPFIWMVFVCICVSHFTSLFQVILQILTVHKIQ